MPKTFKETRTTRQILADILTSRTLDQLCEYLDSCHDLYDLGCIDSPTEQDILNHLSEESALCIWAIHRYANTGDVNKEYTFNVVLKDLDPSRVDPDFTELRESLDGMYHSLEIEQQQISDNGRDLTQVDLELIQVSTALEIINAEMDFDDKLNKLEELKDGTSYSLLFSALDTYLDGIIIVETYGKYIETTDDQYIRTVAVKREWFEQWCIGTQDMAVAEFLSEYTWDNTDGIHELAKAENGLVAVWDR
jgi:hypothetical protein